MTQEGEKIALLREKIALLRAIDEKIGRIEALLAEITKTPEICAGPDINTALEIGGDRPYVPNEYSMRVPSSWWRDMSHGVPVQPNPDYAVYEGAGPPSPKAEE
jgi:hypothetical protein